MQSGTLDLASGAAKVEYTADEPTMLYLEVKGPTGRPFTYGAAVEPLQLRPVHPRPRDFDRFWRRKIEELKAVPENAVVTPGESNRPGVDYSTIQMDHVNGTHVYGQMAKPSKPGKYPAVLVLQWASPPYPLAKSWVTDPASQGWLALNIEPHDVIVNGTPEYYRNLPSTLRNYAGTHQDDLDKNYFVEMYLRDYRAVEYLTHCPDWDGKTLLVMGTSMGGQQSLAVCGLHPRVTHMIVNEPAGCDMNASQHGRQLGYPNFNVRDENVAAVAPYIDGINFARNIRATSLVAMGFTDNVAPPAGIWTAFNQIRGRKEAAPMFDSPHNNTATPQQQRPFTQRAAEWMDALVKGQKLEVQTHDKKGR